MLQVYMFFKQICITCHPHIMNGYRQREFGDDCHMSESALYGYGSVTCNDSGWSGVGLVGAPRHEELVSNVNTAKCNQRGVAWGVELNQKQQ